MTIKEICETLITYDDDKLSSTLDSAIKDGNTMLRYAIGTDEYILYVNEIASIGIESITLDPNEDSSDVLELVIDNDDIHGLITMTDFLTDYTFLNNKIAEIQSGTDNNGDVYKYIRFSIASGFDVEYNSVTHAGVLTSIWYEDLQRVAAYYAISIFIPMARRISENTSIYVNESYGDANIVPTGVEEMEKFSRMYKGNGDRMLRSYYIRKHNIDNTETTESVGL
jgi:hypothetical protein